MALRKQLEPLARCPSKAPDRLLIFAKYPRAGKSKTRLAPLLGEEGAAQLHRQLALQTLSVAQTLRALNDDVAVEVYSTGNTPEAMASLFGNQWTYRDQGDGDLGQRLQRAIGKAFQTSARRVLVIGTDCPLLTRQHLSDAFDALASADLVLGPARDGGYYLIGMSRLYRELFGQIPWSSANVLSQTKAVAARCGLKVALLPLLSDMDTPEDLADWAQDRLSKPGGQPWLSIIIPTHNEQEYLAATLGSALACENIEVIVVDAKSSDRTAEIAKKLAVRFLEAEPSRGGQLNRGAEQARADTLLFLHADTLLPPDYAAHVSAVLNQPKISAGAFDLKIDAPGWAFRLIEQAVYLRSRWLEQPYGDQAIFMRKTIFHQCGGFPNLPYMEDYTMLSRLRKLGSIRIANAFVFTSARRWLEHGVVKTTLSHQLSILCYHLGAFQREVR